MYHFSLQRLSTNLSRSSLTRIFHILCMYIYKLEMSQISCMVSEGHMMGLSCLLVFFPLALLILNLSCYSIAESSHFTDFDPHRGSFSTPQLSERVVYVDDYGAQGDGITDDREAFKKAWKDACSSYVPSVIEVSEDRKYLLKPLIFSGPCNSDITMMIRGTLEAPSNRSEWDGRNRRHWMLFHNMQNLVVMGGGTVNGNGLVWWQNSCKINTTMPCTVAPAALTFFKCKDLRLEDLMIKDSPQIHISIENCRNVEASNLFITAPEDSPNTDGIHVAYTRNMIITNCDIKTGDDCISIVAGTQNIKGMNIFCGPGHGISIGSLGYNNSRDYVRNVIMDTITLKGTMNGVRIKTWQGGRGYAKGIMFQNINIHGVQNPIIIDQNYCDSTEPCRIQEHAVEVSHVLYRNIKGTSASSVSVKFDCSSSFPCHGIVLEDVSLVGESGETTQSFCNNVGSWVGSGEVVPPPCEVNV